MCIAFDVARSLTPDCEGENCRTSVTARAASIQQIHGMSARPECRCVRTACFVNVTEPLWQVGTNVRKQPVYYVRLSKVQASTLSPSL